MPNDDHQSVIFSEGVAMTPLPSSRTSTTDAANSSSIVTCNIHHHPKTGIVDVPRSECSSSSSSSTGDSARRRRSSKLEELYRTACDNVRSQYKILIAGQILSFSLSVTGAAQATLYFDCNLSAPTFTVGLFYFGLAFCLIPVYRQGQKQLQGKHQVISQQDEDIDDDHGVASSSEDGQFVGPIPLEDSIRYANKLRSSDNSFESYESTGDPRPTLIPTPQYTFLGVIPLHNPAWKYFPMAILDVYANYFTVLAFSYTTITSVTLFDALAIPTAMVVSAVFLSRKYTRLHLMGVGACSIGILLNVLQDYAHDRHDATLGTSDSTGEDAMIGDDLADVISNGGPSFPNKLRGDLFALLGGVLFGINNTVGEVAVRSSGGPNEYLGMLGVFATCICIVQSILTERDDIAEFFNKSGNKSATCSESTAWWVLVAYFVSAIVCYLGASRFLQVSEAAFYNLSLLTGDLWSVAFSVVAQRIIPQPLFFVALAFILSGVVMYEMAPSPVKEYDDSGEPCDDHTNWGPDHHHQPTMKTERWRRHANPQGTDHEEEVEEKEFELRILT